MSKTRDLIVSTLAKNRYCTITELVEVAQISHISVRHHIQKLEAEGLVDSKEEKHGVGRPRRLYYLTQKGGEQFPSRYLSLTSRLLEQLKGSVPKETLDNLLKQIAVDMASSLTDDVDFENLGLQDRIILLETLMKKEGFTVEVVQHEDLVEIKELSCPYYQVGQDHPEVCIVDRTLISNILDMPVEKISCILDGDHLCTYEISMVKFNGYQKEKKA